MTIASGQFVRDRVPFVQWHVQVDSTDRARWVTWTTVMGLLVAGGLVVAGGLPFDLPMPTYRFGVVTPTCGLTRGSTAIARGDLALAWQYNPVSFLVMGFGLLGVARTGLGFAAQRWVIVNCTRSRLAWILIGVTIAAFWAYQQTNADFIIHSRR